MFAVSITIGGCVNIFVAVRFFGEDVKCGRNKKN
jgi:hypothetical protein